jgi:hypothetical protein
VPLRFYVVPVGGGDAENVAIESVELLDGPAIAGSAAEVEVRVRNYGPTPRPALDVRVYGRGASVPANVKPTVNLPPEGAQSVKVPVTFYRAGSHVVTASVRTSGLTTDDDFATVVEVLDPIEVLVISGEERQGLPMRGESDFLRLALSPFTGAATRPSPRDPARVTVLSAEQWEGQDLSRYGAVVLANVAQLTAAQVRSLEQYVYGGGGLLIAPGGTSRVENYNAALWREGAGLMPAKLEAATGERAGGGEEAGGAVGTGLSGFNLSHPIFHFLRGRPDATPSSVVERYFPALPAGGEARVLGRYANGRPFLIEAQAGRGRVMLVTTPLDADWSNLPLTSFYLPFVQSAVKYLASARLPAGNVAIGKPIQLTAEDVGKTVVVDRPDLTSRAPQVTRVGGKVEVRYTETDLPGRYTVRGIKVRSGDQLVERPVYFVVQPSRGESDLTPLTAERWRELRSGLGFEAVDPTQKPIGVVVASERTGKELWGPLLGVVLALGVAELAAERWWSAEVG